jgi:hypothetical protein
MRQKPAAFNLEEVMAMLSPKHATRTYAGKGGVRVGW